jgi:peptide/nickel transport system permease protein
MVVDLERQPAETGDADAAVYARESRAVRARRFARALLRSRLFVVGTVVSAFWVGDALLWRVIVPYDPQALDPLQVLQGPSGAHWFGTDNLGRDVLSRVLAGAESVLTIAPAATLIGIGGGIVVGLIGGYFRGRIDDLIQRIVEALLSFPLIITAVLVLSALGRSSLNVTLVIGFIFVPIVSRTVRSAVLAEREKEYVAAGRVRGDSSVYMMFVEILPNITGPIAVEATVRLGYAVFASATLAFLGLGVGEPSPDWGLTIAEGRSYMQSASWMVLFPAAALATLVVAVNFMADGLKQVVDE